MIGTSRQLRIRGIAFACLLLLAMTVWHVRPVAASFSLDYTLTGRIWVSDLAAPADDIEPTNRDVALLDFGDCTGAEEQTLPTLDPRQRDCRFEQQVAVALARSAIFRRVSTVSTLQEATDLVLVPLGSRAQFDRRAIPAAKPFIYLSLFTYVWTPLPYERDTESYHLNFAILDRSGARQTTVTLDRQYTHSLGTYSADHSPSPELKAAIKPHEVIAGSITTCHGPHASTVVHELLRLLATNVRNLKAPNQ
jgi:hypothetical protein